MTDEQINIMLDDGAKMPNRAHDTDAGLDLFSRTKPEKFITDWLSREKAAIHETVNDDGGLDFDLDDIFEKP